MNVRFDQPLGESQPDNPSRREALKMGGLVVAFLWLGGGAKVLGRAAAQGPVAAGDSAFAPNAFIRVGTDGAVHLVMPSIEMGQGAYSGQATLLAEEMDLGLDQVVVEHAPANRKLYANPLLGEQATGGSTTIRFCWTTLRQAGAAARALLVGAAAAKWKVDPAQCTVARGVIRHEASGRSLGYGEVANAAAQLPVPEKVQEKDAAQFALIGKPLRRVDTAGKVDGSLQFSIDLRVPDMKVATVKACPTFGGKLVAVDDSRARQVPGFVAVLKIDNAVAAVGEHFWAAKQALDALDITWDHGPNAQYSTEQLFKDLAEASKHGTPIPGKAVGNVDGVKGKALEATYQLPLLAHATMEPQNAIVHVRPDGCDIWTGTQVPARCVDVAVKLTGLKPESIVVHNQYMGGGFGRRLFEDPVEQAVAFARQVSYPLKMVWTREEDIAHDRYRPAYYDRIAATLGDDGKPVAWTHRITSGSVLATFAPGAMGKNGMDSDAIECAADVPYEFPNMKVEWVRHDMPEGVHLGWWRGVGPVHNVFVVESFMDELAHAAGKDPLVYRREQLQKNPRALGVLNLAAEKAGWGKGGLPARVGRGVAVAAPFGSYLCVIVEAEVSPQGEVKLRRAVAAVDCGIAVNPNTVAAQVQGGLIFGWTAALYNGITIKHGAVEQHNFNDYRMMRINETPALEVHLVDSKEAPGGIGETGTVMAFPALFNALFAATGVRLRSYPIDRAALVQGPDALKAVITQATDRAAAAKEGMA